MTSPVVDVHTHLAPDLSGLVSLPADVELEGGRLVIDGERVGMPALYDVARLLDWMGTSSVDRAWVSPPPPFFRQGLDPTATAAWVGALNDGVAARIAGQDTLDGLAYLPFDQPEVALQEVARLGSASPFRGWIGAAGGGSLPLDHERTAPLWDAIEALGRPVLLHPGFSPDRRLDPHYLSNLVGNPVETTVAAAELVFGDVLGRRPDLRVVLVHCGGAVAALAGRWQRGVDSARPGVGPLSLGPREAVRRLWVDALAHDPALVELALRVIGEDKVVLGSDWPFPMGLDDPVGSLDHLATEQVDRVARTNVLDLVGAER